ncbi:MAG TPA: hypothetical protein VJ843_05865 [Candidatus Saccharimonadales bacterium]|nr:hypothetical protein [Candidatus Saccharimonadales bacterium]
MIFEHIISAVAPFACLGCKREGSILCAGCQAALPPNTFVGTGRAMPDYLAATAYGDVAKDVVHALKFGRAQAAAGCIARVMADRIALPGGPWLVTHIPTANSRVRLRGYDQARLIARHFAHYKGVPHASLLVRTGSARQVGANRADRFMQASTLFRATHLSLISQARILLVDDVITTGASMHAASQVLMEAGAQAVYPAAFARAE